MPLSRFILAGLALLALSACASPEREIAVDNNPLTPMPEFNDPDDKILAGSVQDFLKETGAPLYSEYEFTRADLDTDGRRDALVLFKNPYGFWCGGHGCTMLVLKANNDSFTLVNSVQPIRTPLEISNQKQHGWKTMIARVSGRTEAPRDVALMFDGQAYPQDPSTLPAFDTAMFTDGGIRVFP
jgi:putative lipoprotein